MMLKAEGIKLAADDGTVARGFYVWRCVTAGDEASARTAARDIVKADPRVASALAGADASIVVEKIKPGWGALKHPGTGYIFFGGP